jgi:5-methylcytosine-specific restriction endonuclease McrA
MPHSTRRPRLKLDAEAYKQLHRKILERDGWRCQHCGLRINLQVHHLQSRSLLGDDAEENLITLCAECHQELHLRTNSDRPKV